MISGSRLILLLFVFLLAGCSASPASTVIPPFTETPTIVPSPTNAAAEPGPALVAGQWTTMFYHPVLEKVILVNGGPDRGKPATDPLELWAWDGAQWSLLSADPEGPSWRNFAGAAFDTQRNVLVLHGGLQNAASRMDETWEWDGQSWRRFDVPGPGFREGAVMAYDVARGEMVLFGGGGEDFEMLGDTWTWDGNEWTQASTSGPSPRFPSAIAYDAAREKVLLFSGHSVDGNEFIDYDDLWAWDGSTWSEIVVDSEKPGPHNIAQMVYYPTTKEVLLSGGGEAEFLGDLWAWNGTSWRRLLESGAPTRSGLSAAYDPVRDRLVAFGGVERPGGTAVSDTWEWDGQTWECVWGCS
ncbi:MAG TPA: hypothetical protein VFY26_23270 [Anaerolineales bacterium]|nr:hypothetical protein [Anaerolineales bacterium]